MIAPKKVPADKRDVISDCFVGEREYPEADLRSTVPNLCWKSTKDEGVHEWSNIYESTLDRVRRTRHDETS